MRKSIKKRNFEVIQPKLQNKTKSLRFIICLSIFLFTQLAFSDLLLSQARNSETKQETLQHEVTVTLKLIQVYVTDKKGNPVTDLNQTDFELYDKGKLINITDFEKHILYLPAEKTREIIPAVFPEVPSQMNRKFFLFFDFAFNNVRGIKKSKEAALHFIDTKLQPTDEVGVLSYSTMKSLTLHEYLTTDHQKVREVVEGFGLKDVLGRAENILRKGRDSSLRKEIYKHQVFNFSNKIKDLAKALRYIPGHKHIVFFSSGVINSVVYGHGHGHLRWKWEDMAKELASANCLVYAVDAGSFVSSIDSETGFFYIDRYLGGGSTLERLAEVTGGKYFGNITNYENIMEEIQDLSNAYYVLGYYIDEKWNGKYHKIKVKVKRKGCKVHGQGGYFNPKPFTKYTKLEKRIHLIDLALNEKPYSQIQLLFPLLTLPCSVQGESQLVMISKIPVERLQEISGKKVEIVNLIFDKQNYIVGFKRGEVNFLGYSQKNIYYYSLSTLPPGEYKCCIILRNLETGRGARISSSVVIPERLDSGLQVDTPLLLKPEKSVLYLTGRLSDKREKGGKYPTLLDIYPFDSTQYSPLVKELEQGTTKLLAMVRCSIIDIQQPEVKFSGHLIHLSTSKKTPLSLSVLNKYQEKDTQIYLIELATGELIPGKYSLYLIAEEMNTKLKSPTSTTFIIR